MLMDFSSLPERYQAKIEPEPMSGCWLWAGARSGDYGQIWDGQRREWAHRAVYAKLCGPVPPGFDLDHKCRVTFCVNPWHLRVSTRRENLMAPGSLSPSKANAEKTVCVRGHPYTKENTYLRPDRYGRMCFTCHTDHNRARHLRERKSRAKAKNLS